MSFFLLSKLSLKSSLIFGHNSPIPDYLIPKVKGKVSSMSVPLYSIEWELLGFRVVWWKRWTGSVGGEEVGGMWNNLPPGTSF